MFIEHYPMVIAAASYAEYAGICLDHPMFTPCNMQWCCGNHCSAEAAKESKGKENKVRGPPCPEA
jgi:hypothetical protein